MTLETASANSLVTAAQAEAKPTARAMAESLYNGGMRCNCDLDNWEPKQSTGHSWVCRIHTTATEMMRRGLPIPKA